ncbi:unnamed protein product [Prunus brigantina]
MSYSKHKPTFGTVDALFGDGQLRFGNWELRQVDAASEECLPSACWKRIFFEAFRSFGTILASQQGAKMSKSSDKESQDPPAFGGEDIESDEPSLVLEAIADRVLALPQTPEVGSSNQAGPSGSAEVVVASASEGLAVQVGVPLPRKNTLRKVKLGEIRSDYSVPPSLGLRLPTAADVMMLAKLGYAPGKYNRNFWILPHRKAALAREVDDLKERLASSEWAFAEGEQKKGEEIAAAREETLAKFNPSLQINFDTSGVPPSISPAAEATVVASSVKETTIIAPEPATTNVPHAEA